MNYWIPWLGELARPVLVLPPKPPTWQLPASSSCCAQCAAAALSLSHTHFLLLRTHSHFFWSSSATSTSTSTSTPPSSSSSSHTNSFLTPSSLLPSFTSGYSQLNYRPLQFTLLPTYLLLLPATTTAYQLPIPK